MANNRLSGGNQSGKMRRWGIIAVLLLIAVVILWVLLLNNRSACSGQSGKTITPHQRLEKQSDSVSDHTLRDTVDSATQRGPDTQPELFEKPATQAAPSRRSPPYTPAIVQKADSAAQFDSGGIAAQEDSIIESTNPCTMDTIGPWVFPDPSGGLHRQPVRVRFQASEICTITWRFENDSDWKYYYGDEILIGQTATLLFSAVDSCGNVMETRIEHYEIEELKGASPCPKDMEFVKMGDPGFCIDKYEWPNRRGAQPLSYISLYHAMDSCYSVGKRLCSSEEWTMACTGPYSWQYPYGQAYEFYACATQDSMVRRSGSKPECRGYFEVYDMSGSLMEWTSTPSRENRSFHNVMGGFWESGSKSGCYDMRYSYFPQNRHNPVGFRCCGDIKDERGGSQPDQMRKGRSR